MRKEQKRRTLK
jgi:hypothetical protein